MRVLSPITAHPRTPPGVGTPLRVSGGSAPPAKIDRVKPKAAWRGERASLEGALNER